MRTGTGIFSIYSEPGTTQLATALAALVQPGDILCLKGGLGVGKTVLVRAFLRALAGDETLEVPSPTFSLVQPFTFGTITCLHADLFRLGDESEAAELGLFDDTAIRLVEWPDLLPELADDAAFSITLDTIGASSARRRCTVVAEPARLRRLVCLLRTHSDIVLNELAPESD